MEYLLILQRQKDYVRDVEFVYQEALDGSPLYIGWIAITDFSGSISDEAVQGIRFRKGNIDSGAITSDEKREQIAERLEKIARTREKDEKTVRKALERGTFDERKEAVEKALSQAETATKKVTALNTKIVNAGYATKNDLPSSYSRDERKLYQRIISVIDTYFTDDPKTAEALREKIKSELSVKKK